MNNANAVRGMVFEIRRFSVHYGPGIRTAVLLKGCHLCCAWCPNPESISFQTQISFDEAKCTGCGYCVEVCPRGAHAFVDEKHVFNRDLCILCCACVHECHTGALDTVGKEMTVDETLAAVLRDRAFFHKSGGGVTLSGGEPACQPAFSEAFLRAAKEAGLHCCVLTSGYCAFDRLERMLPYTDLFLYDIKETDAERHRAFAGVPNDAILENLRALHARGAAIRLRCPIIPGYNDRADHFAALAALDQALPNSEGIELIPCHPLTDHALTRLGMGSDSRAHFHVSGPSELNAWMGALHHHGARVLNALDVV
jgi:pyruvate formate lyase activating enzyme